MKLIGIPYDEKENSYKHFSTLEIQNRLYLKMAKTELACLCMEPFKSNLPPHLKINPRICTNNGGSFMF